MKPHGPITDTIEWECLLARTRIHKLIDARADAALRLIHALAERDRRAIGQLTRFDHIRRRTIA